MRSGKPAVGSLYVTSGGRTVEVLAVESVECLDMVETANPVGSAEVIAYRFLGGGVIHLAALHGVQDWVKVPGV